MGTKELDVKLDKIVSLHPDTYEKIKLEDLIEKYGRYCNVCGVYGNPMKDFTKWRLTEI
jgi:hypothetical protein